MEADGVNPLGAGARTPFPPLRAGRLAEAVFVRVVPRAADKTGVEKVERYVNGSPAGSSAALFEELVEPYCLFRVQPL